MEHGSARPSIIVTGADANYGPLMIDTLMSLRHYGYLDRYDLGVMDLGLTDEQLQTVKSYGAKVLQPGQDLDLPPHLRHPKHYARTSRPFLPRYFPGYDWYVWIDGDAWVQDSTVIDDYVAAARPTGFAVVREQEPAYEFDWRVFGWNVLNFLKMYGPVKGPYLYLRCPPLNNGIFALAGDAPHWAAWARHYQHTIDKAQKMYNQFSLIGAVNLEKLPVTYLTGENNWICSRGKPMWDAGRERFCLPYPGHKQIRVMHLAGSDKMRTYMIRTTDQKTLTMSLRFPGRIASASPEAVTAREDPSVKQHA